MSDRAYDGELGATRMVKVGGIADLLARGKNITKIGFWEDSSGNIKYIKFYDGEEELYVLTFSDAGASAEETWNITRS